MTVPSHLQTHKLQGNYIKQSLKTSCSTKRFSEQLATSCHFKHPPAKVVKGQTQKKGHRPPLSSNPKHSKNENSLKKQALQVSHTLYTCAVRNFSHFREVFVILALFLPQLLFVKEAQLAAHLWTSLFHEYGRRAGMVPRSSLKEGKYNQMVEKRTKTTQQQTKQNQPQPTGRDSTTK